jgi:hypothetical protein
MKRCWTGTEYGQAFPIMVTALCKCDLIQIELDASIFGMVET